MTEELQRLAWTDTLTLTSNRRALMDALAEEYRGARRYEHPLTILMMDLDHFKAVNDRYGHEAGDSALRSSADAIRPLLRDTDHFARMGGEKFAILLPETDLAEGSQIAERLRRAVAGARVPSSQRTFSITVSIGVAEMHAHDAGGESILNRVDRALYEAKAEGRDRVAGK